MKVCEPRTRGREPRRRLWGHLGGLLVPPSSPKELLETRGGSFGAAFGAALGALGSHFGASGALWEGVLGGIFWLYVGKATKAQKPFNKLKIWKIKKQK